MIYIYSEDSFQSECYLGNALVFLFSKDVVSYFWFGTVCTYKFNTHVSALWKFLLTIVAVTSLHVSKKSYQMLLTDIYILENFSTTHLVYFCVSVI